MLLIGDAQGAGVAFEQLLAALTQPGAIALALALTTLLLEDLAIAAGVALAAQGAISWELSFAAVAGGIAAGDLGLYALGVAALRVPWLRRRAVREREAWLRMKLVDGLAAAVLLARIVPGLRLVTYTAAGFLRVPLLAFGVWVLLAVLLWTAGLYALSAAIGRALAASLGVPVPMAVALPIVFLALGFSLWRWARERRHALQGQTS